MMASPTWLAAVDEDPSLATQPVGTGPFMVTEYLPGDRMTVVKNPDYWRQDEAGNQLPYLDEIEFRVIVDSQTRQAALESGEVDLIATVGPDRRRAAVGERQLRHPAAERADRDGLHDVAPDQAAVPEQGGRAARWPRRSTSRTSSTSCYAGYPEPSNGPFTPGQDGYLEDTGLPEYDPDAARAAIEAWEAENGPLTINYSTTPTGTNKAAADYLQQKWGEVGVDVTQTVIEQSRAHQQRPVRHAGVRGVRMAQPRRHLRRQPELLVERLRLRRLRRRDRRWRALAELRAPQRPRDQRPARPGPLGDRPGGPQGAGPGDQPPVRQECWILPAYQVEWGIHMDPKVQNIGYTPLVDGDGYMLDGAGFPGQVWLTSVWVEE